jgi:Tfp pilus assembly protein PilV
MKREQSQSPQTARSSFLSCSRGASLIEVLVATLVLTIGLVGMAQLMGISMLMHLNAREKTTATQLAQAKVDELMKLNLATAPAVQITPASPDSLATNVANYFDSPQAAITRRWRVSAGPAANTRILTVRVINARARQGGQVDVSTIIRQW